MTNPVDPFSPFLPATFNIPEEEDRRKTFLNDKFSQFADVINDKKIGAYTQATEAVNGNKFAYDTTSKVRSGSQAMARIPSFPNAGVLILTTASDPAYPVSDVNEQFVISHVWGSASKPCSAVGAGDGDYFSFMNRGDPRITFTVTDTTITITTTVDLSLYSGFLFLEFIRDGT